MGAEQSCFLPVPKADMTELKASTKFTRGEIDYLYVRFREIGVPSGRVRFLIKKDFEFVSTVLRSIILGAMFGDKNRLNFIDFVKFLHHFRPYDKKAASSDVTNMETKKLKLLFSMYDMNKDGWIDQDDLLEIVHRLLSHYSDIHSIVEVASRVMMEMDNSKIGKILFEDFCAAFEGSKVENLIIKFPSI